MHNVQAFFRNYFLFVVFRRLLIISLAVYLLDNILGDGICSPAVLMISYIEFLQNSRTARHKPTYCLRYLWSFKWIWMLFHTVVLHN